MNSLLKKTWLIFYILAFSGLITLITVTFLRYAELEKNLKTEQLYMTQLFDSHISSAFFQFETMLDLIGYEYTFQKNLNINVIENVLNKSPLLIGFSLFNTDGNPKFLSRNLQSIYLSNLLLDTSTEQWFKKTLTQKTVNIGPPYFHQLLKKWIVPIRKKITTSQGKVLGVVVSGLDIETWSSQWQHSSNKRLTLQATLDGSFHHILRTNIPSEMYGKFYGKPIPKEKLEKLKQQLVHKEITPNKLRNSGEAFQLTTVNKQKIYSTIYYNKKLSLWLSTFESDRSLRQKLILRTIIYSIFYLVFLVVIYSLFRWVVSIEKDKMTELTYRAEHDILTGLYNRSILKNKNLKYNKKNHHFSLLYVDLDHFKGINDSYGYSYGDAILVQVSKRINKGLETVKGTAIRLSADEFILLLENTDRPKIEEYCNTLLADINTPYIVNNNDFKISASIGIAQSPADSSGMETLISYANNSMLIAKKTKNNFVFFSEKIHQQLIKNIEIEQALYNALSKNEINIVYQPQLNNQGQLCGVEALARWNNDKLGCIPPDQFIPIAEETGLMPELGTYIMNKAIEEISTLQSKKKKSFQLSINVSARQFAQLNFFETLLDCLTCYKSPYLAITIEITESLFIENIERLLPIFQKMKKENIFLSLDDFGTGYSSLSMLRNVPIDELKIDKSFVDHITLNKNDCAMVESIITMGKNLGMTILAEGVEDKQQLAILQNAGCDIYQGYYFSKPLNLANLEQYIDTL